MRRLVPLRTSNCLVFGRGKEARRDETEVIYFFLVRSITNFFPVASEVVEINIGIFSPK